MLIPSPTRPPPLPEVMGRFEVKDVDLPVREWGEGSTSSMSEGPLSARGEHPPTGAGAGERAEVPQPLSARSEGRTERIGRFEVTDVEQDKGVVEEGGGGRHSHAIEPGAVQAAGQGQGQGPAGAEGSVSSAVSMGSERIGRFEVKDMGDSTPLRLPQVTPVPAAPQPVVAAAAAHSAGPQPSTERIGRFEVGHRMLPHRAPLHAPLMPQATPAIRITCPPCTLYPELLIPLIPCLSCPAPMPCVYCPAPPALLPMPPPVCGASEYPSPRWWMWRSLLPPIVARGSMLGPPRL